MTIGSLYIKPLGVLMMIVPFVLVFISIWLRSVRVNKNTAGYVSNASSFSFWLFMLTVLSVVISLVAGIFDSNLNFFSYGLWFLVLLAMLFFICYWVIAFKPVTAEQLEEVRDEGGTFFEVAGLSAAGVAAGLMGTLSWTMKMLARAPIDIVRRSGDIIWYRNAGIGSFMGNITGILIVLAALGLILAFLAMWFLLIIVVLAWVLVVYKFVRNLVYINGPRT